MKKIINLIVMLALMLSMATPIFAQGVDFGEGHGAWEDTKKQLGPLAPVFGGQTDLRIVIANLLKYFLTIIGLIFMVYIVYAGFTWLTAAGNSDKIKTAKSTLQTGIIGMVVIIFAFAIARFVIIAARCATDTAGSWCAFLNNIAW